MNAHRKPWTTASYSILGAIAFIAVVCQASTAAVYVVDQAHPAADDQNPGTEEKPFKTIQRAADAAQAADTVYVMEGDYPGRLTIKTSGAEGKPIVFRALPTRGVTVEGIDVADQTHIRIDGFKVFQAKPTVNVDGIHIGKGAANVEIENCLLQNLYTGIGAQGRNGRVAFCRFYQVQYGILCSGDHWLVENCDLERMFYFDGKGGLADCDYSRFWGKDHVIRFNRYHGTHHEEVGDAHLDCVQSFNVKKDNPGTYLHHLTFEYNVCTDFGQVFMMSTSTPGTHHHFTFRNNIMFGLAKGTYTKPGPYNMLNLTPISNTEAHHNTFVNSVWHGFRNGQGEESVATNNLFFNVTIPLVTGPQFTGKKNLLFNCKNLPPTPGPDEIVSGDPKFADAENGNFRLTPGNAAINAGVDGTYIGALEYPNIYYVDPHHPGASDDGFGYPGWPYKTMAKALSVAQAGETIVLRGGVYRETLKPVADGITVRAMKDEKAILSGADLVEGWKRTEKGWIAPLAAEPRKLLRDGQAWTDFSYDATAKTITVTAGGDPRMHVFETVARSNGIDLSGRKDVKIERVEVVNVQGEM